MTNRFDRIISILIQLQSKKIVRAQDIADRFGISLRTVYRDIRSLEEAGVPVIGEAGTGYSIMEGYRLPPVMFSRDEAAAFLMAEKILEKYTDSKTAAIYSSALEKVKAVLRSAEKDYLEGTESSFMVLRNTYTSRNNDPYFLQGLLNILHEKRPARIAYKKIEEQNATARDIEPVGVYLQNSFWYLIAWCRTKKAYRNFRVDRITRLSVLEEVIKTKHPTLSEYLDSISSTPALHRIVIQVDKDVAKYLENQKYYQGFVSQENKKDKVEMTFMVAWTEMFLQWFIGFADHASLISPDETKKRFKAMVNAVMKRI